MPGIEELLGGNTQAQEDAQMQEASAGMGLPTEGDNGEGNPLEKMDELSKQRDKKKKDKGGTDIDSDVLKNMFMTGDNTEGMFSPNPKDEIDGVKVHEEPDEKAKVNTNNTNVTPKGKYTDKFKKDFLKHPEDYTINTPKGEMSVAEAMQQGYDPLTKTFRNEHNMKNKVDERLSQLNDADRTSIEGLLQPEAAQVAPADAGKYGLKPNSPFIKQPAQPEEQVPPMQQQAAPAGLGVAGAPVPGAQESQMAGSQDLSALLGGNA